MTDHDIAVRAFRQRAGQQVFQPENSLNIEMVGGFIHDQDVRMNHQGSADGQSFAPSPGQELDRTVWCNKFGPAEQGMYPVMLFNGGDIQLGQRCLQIFRAGQFLCKDIILGKIADLDMLLPEEFTAVRFNQITEDLEQGGFAGTVGADQADFIAFIDDQVDRGKQGLGTKGLADILAGKKIGHYPSMVKSSALG